MFFFAHHPALLLLPDKILPFKFLNAKARKRWLKKASARQN